MIVDRSKLTINIMAYISLRNISKSLHPLLKVYRTSLGDPRKAPEVLPGSSP